MNGAERFMKEVGRYSSPLCRTRVSLVNYGLRQGVTGPRLHETDIGAVQETVEVEILPEIGSSYRLSGLSLRLRNVGRVYETIGRGIARENAHRNGHIAGVGSVSHT